MKKGVAKKATETGPMQNAATATGPAKASATAAGPVPKVNGMATGGPKASAMAIVRDRKVNGTVIDGPMDRAMGIVRVLKANGTATGRVAKGKAVGDPNAVVDLRYEDLIADPVGEVEQLYRRLDLGDFEPLREKLTAFVGKQKDYKTNKHEMDEELKAKIRERWAGYFERYRYE